MVNAYLWLNALLYIALALWCTLAPESTAQAVGFTALTPAGQTEFLAVYGGMEFGIGLLFAYFARSRHPRNGLVMALLFYAPIVAWRAYAIAATGCRAARPWGWWQANGCSCSPRRGCSCGSAAGPG